MFEFLMLLSFFGVVFWFTLPDRRPVPSRRTNHTQKQLRKPILRKLPRDGAEQWFHSGRN